MSDILTIDTSAGILKEQKIGLFKYYNEKFGIKIPTKN
jgi:hypothetical protein